MIDSRTGAVNIQDELGAFCATRKVPKKKKKPKKPNQTKTKNKPIKHNDWEYVKGTKEPTEGAPSD